MDPNLTVRPWLLSVGETFGAREAHNRQWTDSDREASKPYFEYHVISCRQFQDGHVSQNSKTGNDVNFSAFKEYELRVQIDLYRDEDGLANLARCEIAAEHNQAIRNIFSTHGVSFWRIDGDIADLTPIENQEKEWKPLFHHRMIVVFRENIQYDIEQVDAAVNEIQLRLGPEFNQYSITDSGIEIIP